MRFLCDVHISIQLVKFLSQHGFEAIHVNGLPNKWNTTDSEICKLADANDYVVISKDQDFRNSHFISGTPKKLIRITLGNISNKELITIFENHLTILLKAMNSDKFYIEIGKEFIEQNKN